ncbi:MAG: dGTP triphosphohydrolase, partial [Planctomycetota bacterium]
MTGAPRPLPETEPGRLASYASRASESRGRRVPETPHAYRSAFQRDRDRIVHSAAFRRLEHKTQVFVSSQGDHYRTRLTHTLEAAQIARTLSRALGLNEDLTESVALAHDLGHAPFGHAGGEALQEVMQEHGGFDHNRQSLRVVDVLERRYARFAGLNLSYEVRESIVKHGHDASTKTPEEGERRVPELADFDKGMAPLLEAQLVDHCDSIAYDTHDLDDGLRSGLLTLDQVGKLGIWQRAEAAVKRRQGALFLDDPALARHAVVRRIVDLVATDLIHSTRAAIE